MMRTNTVSDSANVTFKSVLGTTFRCSIPAPRAIEGSRSTGTTSMRLKRNTQQKMVRPSGARSLFVPWNESFTWPSTNSMSISTKFWNLPGTPAVAVRAAA